LSYGHFKSKGVHKEVDFTLNMDKYRWNLEHDYYTELYRNKEFVKLLNEVYEKTISIVFNNASIIIDQYVEEMPKSIEMNKIRWNKNSNMEDYYKRIEKLKDFIKIRTQYLNERYSTETKVIYNTYIRNNDLMEENMEKASWNETWKKDGDTSGVINGFGNELENIKITLANSEKQQNIKYDVHTYKNNWLGWKYNGSEFENKNEENIDAIRIELEGMPKQNVAYRVYIKDNGWQEWKYNGEVAGTMEDIIQAIEIKIE